MRESGCAAICNLINKYAYTQITVSFSTRHQIKRMRAVFAEIVTVFGLSISETKTGNLCMSTPDAPVTQRAFHAMGKQYRQKTFFAY